MKINGNEETSAAAGNTPPIALKFAPPWKRVVSFIIDKAILILILALFIFMVYNREISLIINAVTNDLVKNPNSSLDSFRKSFDFFINSHTFQFIIAQIVIEASYFSLSWSSSGQTIGGRIMKIFVMTLERKRLSILQGIVRYIIIYLSGTAFYILQIIVFNPVYQQRIHDFFSGSVVIEVPVLKLPKDDEGPEFEGPEEEE